MGKRSVRILALLVSLAAAAPASAAEAYQLRLTEEVIYASFTNIPEGDYESLPPGEYMYADVWAAGRVATGSSTYQEDYVCVWATTFTVDADLQHQDSTWFGACGPADVLQVDRRLRTGHVSASLPVTDCAAWDESSGECLEVIELGTLVVDLSLTGIGDIRRIRGTSTYGEAGAYAYVFHGTGSAREATPDGTIALDGLSLIDGATRTSGELFSSSVGWIEVAIGG